MRQPVWPSFRSTLLCAWFSAFGLVCCAQQPSEAPATTKVATNQPSATPAAAKPTPAEPAALPPAPSTVRIPLAQHAWARFEVGAWRTLKTVTETYDDAGKFLLRSETLHTDKLVEVTEETFTLETSSVVEIGGKRLRGAAKRIQYSLLSDYSNTAPLVTTLSPADVNLSGRTIPCQRWELAIGEGTSRRLETLYYNKDLPPHFFRRELSAADSTAAELTTATETVLATELPILVEGAMISAYQVQVQTISGANSTERLEVRAADVPGGLINACSLERNANGRRIRWEVTQLEDYGQQDDPATVERRPWRLFPRRGR